MRTWIVFVLMVLAVGCDSRDPMAADPSGKAHFETTDWEVDVQCHGADKPTATGNPKDTRKANRPFEVQFEYPESKDCVTSTGKPSKTTSWRVRTNKADGGWERLRTLDCPCTAASPTLLNLKWKDFQMIAYPGGELATYYQVRFNLSEAAGTGRELATWTAWVRVPGGHTHYGHLGSKLIEVDLDGCSPGAKLVECAQRAAGQEFAQPPTAPVG